MSYGRIGITGDFYSGKTTLGRTLKDRGWVVFDQSAMLKELASQALRSIGKDIPPDTLNRDKARYRGFLKEFGATIGWDDGFGVRHCLRKWDELSRPEPVAVTDIRSQAQWDLLASEGFTLVRLVVPAAFIKQRALALGVSGDQLEQMQRPENSFKLPLQPNEVIISSIQMSTSDGGGEVPSVRQMSPDEVADLVIAKVATNELGVAF